MQRNGEELRDL